MRVNYYALTFEATRLIAQEVEPDEVAVLLSVAEAVLLATPVDLLRIAFQHGKELTVRAGDELGRTEQCRRTPASPERLCVGVRHSVERVRKTGRGLIWLPLVEFASPAAFGGNH